MKKLILITVIGILPFGKLYSQEFFSEKRPVQTANQFVKSVNDISYDIDLIIKQNKDLLKIDLDRIDLQVESKELTMEDANKLRNEKAEFYANQIEVQTKVKEDEIKKLINNKIEDNINFSSDMSAYQKQLVENKSLFFVKYGASKNIMVVKNDENYFDKKGVISGFEVGFGLKTRLGNDLSRLYWNSGLDALWQNHKLNNNKTIADVNNATILVDVGFPVKKSNLMVAEFRLENYLEYDFSKRKYDDFGNTIVKSRQSLFLGAGGFFGYGIVSKNLQYEKDGELYRESVQSKFNANHFTYGLGAYVGYKFVSLKASYNFNKVFKNSFADQNTLNVSLILNLM